MDITERKLAEALRDEESHILEMIARDAPLEENTGEAGTGRGSPISRIAFARSCSSTRTGNMCGMAPRPAFPRPTPRPSTALHRTERRDRAARPCIEENLLLSPTFFRIAPGSCYREVAKPYGLRACLVRSHTRAFGQGAGFV